MFPPKTGCALEDRSLNWYHDASRDAVSWGGTYTDSASVGRVDSCQAPNETLGASNPECLNGVLNPMLTFGCAIRVGSFW